MRGSSPLILNANIFGNPSSPNAGRSTLFSQAASGGGLSPATWETIDAAVIAQRIGDTDAAGNIVAAGGLWESADGRPLVSAKIVDPAIAFFGNVGVEGSFVLPAGAPSDDWDRSAFVFMNAQHAAAGGALNPNNGGIVCFFNTAAIGIFSENAEDGGGATARQAINITPGAHVLRFERQAKIFRGYIDGSLLVTLDLSAFSTQGIDQWDGSFGFGFASSLGTTYPGCGCSSIRVTTL